MAIPQSEAVREFGDGGFERLLGALAAAAPAPRRTARHRPDRGTFARVARNRSDRQTRQSPLGGPAYGAPLRLLILLQGGSVFSLEGRVRLGWIPIRLLRRPVEARELGGVLLFHRLVTPVDNSLGGIRRGWGLGHAHL